MNFNEDRSWMYERLDEYENLNGHFVNGLDRFLDFAFSQTHLLNNGKAKCPCTKCGNSRYLRRTVMLQHICSWGFIPHYFVWFSHGEDNSYQGTSTHDIGQSSGSNYFDEGGVDLVNDAFGGEFENHHYHEMGNYEEPPNRKASVFFELLRAAEVPIRIGSSRTVLEWVCNFFESKVRNVMNVDACERYIQGARECLPDADQHRIPDSLYNMKKMMRNLGLGYKTFDVCVNNCFLFHGESENADIMTCPVCFEERYKPRQNPRARNLVSRKKLWYLPITPRLQRLYMSRNIAEHMTWHMNCNGDSDRMIHPASGRAWKYFDEVHPDFAAEARNVRLGICTDGFAPFTNSSVSYSCWPVFVTPYNLPPDMCMRQEYIFLSLIISGPRSPGKNIDVLLRPLIDELKQLWENGVETYDSFRKQNFQLRASVLWTISDFPAYGMLSQWSTHGRLSCPYCMGETKAFQLQHGRKTTFWDCHRRFLPTGHPWRDNRTDFRYGEDEQRDPIPRKLGDEMYEHVEGLPYIPFGDNEYFIRGFGQTHNWCRRSIFWELPYWKTNLIRHNLDVMHCEKNFFDNIKNTVMDDPEKTKDNLNARRDLQLLTRRTTLFLREGRNGQPVKRRGTYCLEKAHIKLICQWLMQIRFPDGFASNISRCVNPDKWRLTGMKSHDCHVFMQRLLPIAFRGFLTEPVWGPLVEISNFFRSLCAPEIRVSDMELLESSIVETMCKLEMIFPPSFFDSMEHLAIHLPWEAKVGGPVQYRWMYPFERRMFVLKRSVKNKNRIEGSICEQYIFSEITEFCKHYFVNTNLISQGRLNRNETLIDENEVSVFQKKGRVMGSAVGSRFLTAQEYKAAALYVLYNCPEIEYWLAWFDHECCYNVSEQERNSRRDTYFQDWLKLKVLSEDYEVDSIIMSLGEGPLLKVNKYDGYIVNGFRFHTQEEGSSKVTANSGVCVKGNTGEADEFNFYGTLLEIIELQYSGGNKRRSIFLFKCHWYDVMAGLEIDAKYKLVDIKPSMELSTGATEPFILATQAQQVFFTEYPSPRRRGWWAVLSTRARHIVDTSAVSTSVASGVDDTEIYQEDAAPVIGPLGDLNLYNGIQLAVNEFVPADHGDNEDVEDDDGDHGGVDGDDDDGDEDDEDDGDDSDPDYA